jgi:endo-1,4-beta-xylanase
MYKHFSSLLFLAGMALAGKAQNAATTADPKGLKDYYRNYFPVGVAVTPRSLTGEEAQLILQHFNSLTAENAMKMGPIHPQENRYNWNAADSIVSFAQRHGLKVRGHNLCWHEQTPEWLFKDEKGNRASKAVLLQRLKDHITTVVGRYKGKVYAWDVVNEAVNEHPDSLLRNSLWYQICGEEYIAKAFEYAHAADPDALLFYNDYSETDPQKRERIYTLLKKLLDAKVPVHAVGMQGHWSLQHPTENDLRAALDRYASLGLSIQVTELDMTVYNWGNNNRPAGITGTYTYTPEVEQKQAAQYKMIFNVFREYKNVITGVTFWNVSDRYSWLDNFPVRGRKNFPLLFDQNLKPKRAYWEVVRF